MLLYRGTRNPGVAKFGIALDSDQKKDRNRQISVFFQLNSLMRAKLNKFSYCEAIISLCKLLRNIANKKGADLSAPFCVLREPKAKMKNLFLRFLDFARNDRRREISHPWQCRRDMQPIWGRMTRPLRRYFSALYRRGGVIPPYDICNENSTSHRGVWDFSDRQGWRSLQNGFRAWRRGTPACAPDPIMNLYASKNRLGDRGGFFDA